MAIEIAIRVVVAAVFFANAFDVTSAQIVETTTVDWWGPAAADTAPDPASSNRLKSAAHMDESAAASVSTTASPAGSTAAAVEMAAIGGAASEQPTTDATAAGSMEPTANASPSLVAVSSFTNAALTLASAGSVWWTAEHLRHCTLAL